MKSTVLPPMTHEGLFQYISKKTQKECGGYREFRLFFSIKKVKRQVSVELPTSSIVSHRLHPCVSTAFIFSVRLLDCLHLSPKKCLSLCSIKNISLFLHAVLLSHLL